MTRTNGADGGVGAPAGIGVEVRELVVSADAHALHHAEDDVR